MEARLYDAFVKQAFQQHFVKLAVNPRAVWQTMSRTSRLMRPTPGALSSEAGRSLLRNTGINASMQGAERTGTGSINRMSTYLSHPSTGGLLQYPQLQSPQLQAALSANKQRLAQTARPAANPTAGAPGRMGGPSAASSAAPWNFRNFNWRQPGQYVAGSPVGQFWNKMTPNQRLGAGLGGAYLVDQNAARRGQNSMAERYNDMGYLPKLMMALTGRDVPQMSAFNPAWMLPGV